MNRENDVSFELAYGAAVLFTAILESATPPHNPVNVTGYTARLQVLKYDGSEFGSQVLSIVSGAGIVVGTTNGTFACTISAAQSTALASIFGSPAPTEPARFRLFVTPPAMAEVELVHGSIVLLPSGSDVTPVTATIAEATFEVAVSALAPAGPPGPAGPSGSVTVTGGTVTTTTTASTTLRTVALTPSTSFTCEGGCTIKSGTPEQESKLTFSIAGSVDGAGVVTLGTPTITYLNGTELGTVSFAAGTNTLLPTADPASAASTSWSLYCQLVTVN